MSKRNFRVIEGGKKETPKVPERRYRFVKGIATTTRLMGVVGIIGTFEIEDGIPLSHVIHLDFEEYGIDGYHEVVGPETEAFKQTIQKVTGGLGGEYVEIDEKTYGWLLAEAAKVDPNSECLLYDVAVRFGYLMVPEKEDLTVWYSRMDLLGPEVVSDESLIHYYMMRLTGYDVTGVKYLSGSGIPDAWRFVMKTPGTLLKNTITPLPTPLSSRVYRVESLIDYFDRYKLILSEIEVDEINGRRQVKSYKIHTELVLTSHEASFQLRKREHIAIYAIVEPEEVENGFRDIFEEDHPALMINAHGAGDLFTAFNKDNGHVNRSVFYLNGDVYANYYITDEGQLVISSFEVETLHEIEMVLMEGRYLNRLVKVGELTADQPILYDFVNSGYGNLYDYLEDSRP